MTRNVPAKSVSTSFCRPVSFGTSPTRLRASSASTAEMPTIDFSGLCRTRRAYQSTYATASASSTTQSAIRNPMPSPIVTPAESEATPVANGLTVEPVRRRVPELLEAVAERGVDAVLARRGRHLRARRLLRVGRRRPGLARRVDDEGGAAGGDRAARR